MNNKNYYISKDNDTKETVYFEYDKMDGYKVSPKTKKTNSIEVSKIVFVNPELSEKIIRKKIDNKIAFLLEQLRQIEEDEDGGDEGMISRTLMNAEKLRMQIINNYVKYLGHTYESYTLKKIQIIVERLKYKLYMKKVFKEQEIYEPPKTSGKSR